MSRQTYSNGVLVEDWNDETREVSYFDENGQLLAENPDGGENPRPYNDEENAYLDDVASSEARLTALEDRVSAIEAYILAQAPTPDPETDSIDTWVDPTGAHDAYPPDALVTFDGLVYKNVSGAWLVHSPAVYPQGWEHVPTTNDPPPPSETADWAAGVAYSVNDEVMYNGTKYRCLQAHTSQAGWEPTNVPSLWTSIL